MYFTVRRGTDKRENPIYEPVSYGSCKVMKKTTARRWAISVVKTTAQLKLSLTRLVSRSDETRQCTLRHSRLLKSVYHVNRVVSSWLLLIRS